MRLFIALNFPPATLARWERIARELRAHAAHVRWLPTSQMHLTVMFLGEQPDAVVPSLSADLDATAAHYPPLSLDVGGVGAFPNWRRPRVVWLGIAPNPKLMALAADIATACRRTGFAIEDRPFAPHITLGRIDDRVPRPEVHQLARAARDLVDTAAAATRSVDLIESRLRTAGAEHEVVHRAPLLG